MKYNQSTLFPSEFSLQASEGLIYPTAPKTVLSRISLQAASQASPFDVIVVSQVVPLPLFLHAVEHGHRGHEVHYLPCGQQVKVGTAVSATVAIAGDAQGWLRSLFGIAHAD